MKLIAYSVGIYNYQLLFLINVNLSIHNYLQILLTFKLPICLQDLQVQEFVSEHKLIDDIPVLVLCYSL